MPTPPLGVHHPDLSSEGVHVPAPSYLPVVGDLVRIDDVLSGSRDVIGLVGTVTRADVDAVPAQIDVLTPFAPTVAVDVVATRVSPA
jgi:hypothetical protein